VGWREFSYNILFHHTDLHKTNFRAEFDLFPWQQPEPEMLAAWQTGATGVPLVDAGMRELWNTGYMHNRVRMVTASFLIKNMLVDWRIGEAWFWDTLVDADEANNPPAGNGLPAAEQTLPRILGSSTLSCRQINLTRTVSTSPSG